MQCLGGAPPEEKRENCSLPQRRDQHNDIQGSLPGRSRKKRARLRGSGAPLPLILDSFANKSPLFIRNPAERCVARLSWLAFQAASSLPSNHITAVQEKSTKHRLASSVAPPSGACPPRQKKKKPTLVTFFFPFCAQLFR